MRRRIGLDLVVHLHHLHDRHERTRRAAQRRDVTHPAPAVIAPMILAKESVQGRMLILKSVRRKIVCKRKDIIVPITETLLGLIQTVADQQGKTTEADQAHQQGLGDEMMIEIETETEIGVIEKENVKEIEKGSVSVEGGQWIGNVKERGRESVKELEERGKGKERERGTGCEYHQDDVGVLVAEALDEALVDQALGEAREETVLGDHRDAVLGEVLAGALGEVPEGVQVLIAEVHLQNVLVHLTAALQAQGSLHHERKMIRNQGSLALLAPGQLQRSLLLRILVVFRELLPQSRKIRITKATRSNVQNHQIQKMRLHQ